MTAKNDYDTFLDECIENAVEANNCYFGGGGDDDVVTGILDPDGGLDQAQHRLENIITWMKQSQHIHEYAVSDLQDIWYGDSMVCFLELKYRKALIRSDIPSISIAHLPPGINNLINTIAGIQQLIVVVIVYWVRIMQRIRLSPGPGSRRNCCSGTPVLP